MDARTVIPALEFLGIGLVAGVLHFSLLHSNAMLYTRSGRIWVAALLQVVRLSALAGLLVLMALQGALPLLLTALGLMIARPIALRWRTAS